MATVHRGLVRDPTHNLEKVVLKTQEGQTAEVYLHGAHVTSWKDSAGQDLIFVSDKAIFKPPTAIRGGIPVCFPQFGKLGPVPAQHGFARNTLFEVEDISDWSVTLVLKSDGSHAPEWPHPCELRITVALCDNTLQQTMAVKNTGPSEISFTAAFHTYFTVGDIHQVKVTGLKGLTYLDNLQKMVEVEEKNDAVTFTGELDRIYRATPDVLQIHDAARQLVFEVKKDGGFPDAVVWNPWIDKAKSMADYGDDEWQRMVCLETARAASGPATVAPGASWSTKQTLMVRSAAAS